MIARINDPKHENLNLEILDIVTNEVWRITTGRSISDNSNKRLTIFSRSNVYKGSVSDEYVIVLPDPTHEYKIITESSGFDCIVSRGDYLAEVKTDSPGELVVGNKGEVNVKTKTKGELSVTMVSDELFDSTEADQISIIGSGVSSFESQSKEKGITIKADNDGSLSIHGCNDDNSFSETIEDSQAEVIINKDRVVEDELSLRYAKVTGLSAHKYTGKAIKPSPIVRLSGKVLELEKDYTVTYSNNTNPGTATVTIAGIGNYTGTITKTFLILPGKTTRGDMFNLANNVKVTWKEVPGAKYYKVYREGVTDKKETQKEPVIVTERLIGWDSQPGLTNGHAYRYKIVASLTGKGDSSGDSPLSYSKLMYRLKTVVIRSVKNTAAGKVTVKYDKTNSGDSYVLQYCERQDMVGAKTKVVLGANNTSYVIGGLKKGKTYYISIRVRKKVGGIDYYTTFGVPKKIKITK